MKAPDVLTCIVVILGSEFYPDSKLNKEAKKKVLNGLGQVLNIILKLSSNADVEISWESLGGTHYHDTGSAYGLSGHRIICGTSPTHLSVASELGLFSSRFCPLLGDGSYLLGGHSTTKTVVLAQGPYILQNTIEGQNELSTAFQKYLFTLPHNTVLIADQWPVAGYLKDDDCTDTRILLVEHTMEKILAIYPFIAGQLRQKLTTS